MSNEKRVHNIHFMATAEERDMIKQRMEQAGIINMRAYLIRMALDGEINHIDIDGINEMIRLLSNATNNINQIAKRANETGSIYAADIDELRSRYDELWEQTRRILREVIDLMDLMAGSSEKLGRRSKRRSKSQRQAVDR